MGGVPIIIIIMKLTTLFSFILMACAFFSCSQQEDVQPAASVPYTFSGFAVQSGSLDDPGTRSMEAELEYSLLAVDVVDDQFVQKVERISQPSSQVFADLNMDLSVGSHKVYFIIGRQVWDTFDTSTLTLNWNEQHPLAETWGAVASVTVEAGAVPGTVDVDMSHIVTYARLKVADALPEGFSYFRQTLVGTSWSYNLQTQCGGAASTVARNTSIPSSYIGQSGITIGICSFVPAGVTEAAQYIVEAKDASDNLIQSNTFTNVPLEVNRYTMYQGAFFHRSSSFNITLNEAWSSASQTILF